VKDSLSKERSANFERRHFNRIRFPNVEVILQVGTRCIEIKHNKYDLFRLLPKELLPRNDFASRNVSDLKVSSDSTVWKPVMVRPFLIVVTEGLLTVVSNRERLNTLASEETLCKSLPQGLLSDGR
jgi:hypothetical protein